MVTKSDYDLVLLDVLMPGVDGYQTTRLIREAELRKEGSRRVGIFGITAGGMEGVDEKCISAGMNGFLHKPLRFPFFTEYVGKMMFAADQVFLSFFFLPFSFSKLFLAPF